MSNVEIRASFQILTQLMMTQDQVVTSHAQAMMTQSNQGVGPQVNPYANTPASTIRDFMRMNPPTFHGTKVDGDLEGFINEVLKVVDATGVTPKEKAELDAYQLNDVEQVWFEQRRDERPIRVVPID